MKKYIAIVISLVFLAGVSFSGGIFVAEKKISKTSEKVIENIPQDQKKETIEENDGAEIAEEKTEEVKTEEVSAEAEKTSETKFSFAILGDTQYFKAGTNGGYQQAAASIKKMNPNLVFEVGDLTSCDGGSECETKYNNWKNVLGNLSSKAYAMQGNHDRAGKDKSDAAWQKVFSFPTNGPSGFSELVYSFDLENSHFVVLDSDKPKENDINGTQLSWLEGDLAKNKKENIFVFFHEPAYPTNSKMGESLDENPGDRDRLWNIMVKYKVKAVFSGHEHIQSRRKINGLYQFVFGNTDSFNHEAPKPGTAEYSYVGQGFGMVEIVGSAITVKTYSVGGKLLNSFELTK